jgi:hypothetical protein
MRERNRAVATLEITLLDVVARARLNVGQRRELGGANRVLFREPNLIAS